MNLTDPLCGAAHPFYDENGDKLREECGIFGVLGARDAAAIAALGLHVGGADPGGAGLGLAFVSAVAGKHGGRVNVHSEAGIGSTFTLVLPRAFESGAGQAGAGSA